MRENYQFSKMAKAVITQGIIQLVCIFILIAANNIQTNTSDKVVAEGMVCATELILALDDMEYIAVDYEGYVKQHALTASKKQLISEKTEQIDKLLSGLENGLKNAKNEKIDTMYKELNTSTNLFLNSIKNLADKTSESEVNELVQGPVNELNKKVSAIVISMKNEWQEIIATREKVRVYSGGIFIACSLVCLCTIIINTKTVLLSGKELAERQMKAERAAIVNREKAYTDNLTGLWNRKYIESNVNGYIKHKERGYLFMFDMDNFKKVNDVYGHIAGDVILKTFAKVLNEASRECDICCRAGGDEFMLFAYNLPIGEVKNLAGRIQRKAMEELRKQEGGHEVTLSIGISAITKETTDFQQLYDEADNALYHVKENGKNGYYIYP